MTSPDLGRLVVTALSVVGLVSLVTFVIARLARSRLRGLSIRMQVFLALATIVGTFAFGLGLLVLDRVEARAVRLAQATAREEAETVAAILESQLGRPDTTFEQLARRLGADLHAAEQRASRGRLGFESAGLELLDARGRLLYPPADESLATQPGAVVVDVPLGPPLARVGSVRVVKPTLVVQALLADFAPTVLVVSLVLGAFAALSAAWIGRAIAAPLEALSDFAERVSRGERSVLPARVSGREVLRLVRSIDTMQRKLEGRPFVETFAADLSHELKNPVAAIVASAEVLEDGALDDPVSARRFVARIREATERIERLLAELLDLARVETGDTASLTRLDLRAAARAALASLERDTQRVVAKFPQQELRVRADPEWLARALGNLLDNALLHGAEGEVEMALTSEGPYALLRVTNAGAIAPHVREDVFRRFVTTRRDRGGTGLGLSIARAVAEAHGGQVELREAGPPRVVFEMRLPLA